MQKQQQAMKSAVSLIDQGHKKLARQLLIDAIEEGNMEPTEDVFYPGINEEYEAAWLELPDGGSRDYEPVLVKGLHATPDGSIQVWFSTLNGQDIVTHRNNVHFRPIRNSREYWVEKALELADIDRHETAADFAEAIYDAMQRGELPEVKGEHHVQ